ncbi:hypothetical protein MTP03_02930 [Tsukamurella sp. PLM1]|nr:hypothetical protein MTP03_02930 [Tsukamurella sp. PLM1]
MKVVVIGAGYAGVIAANRLVRKSGSGGTVQVSIVNPRSEFVERVRLHEHIAGSGTAVTPLAEMLDPRIRLVVGTVDKIGDGTLLLADGTSCPSTARSTPRAERRRHRRGRTWWARSSPPTRRAGRSRTCPTGPRSPSWAAA